MRVVVVTKPMVTVLNFLLIEATKGVRCFTTRNINLRKTFSLAMVSTITNDAIPKETNGDGSNPFLDQAGLPKFSLVEPKYLVSAVDSQLDQMDAKFKELERRLASSYRDACAVNYDEVLPELERIQFPLSYTWGIAGHLNGVKNGEELRKEYESAQPKVVKAFSEFSQSRVLFDALSNLHHQLDSTNVTQQNFLEQQRSRAVEKSLKQMQLGGVGLEGEKKERFNEIKIRLSELSTKFSNNVLDSTKVFSLTIHDKAKLDGVPASAKAMWAQAFFTKQQQQQNSTTTTADTTEIVDPNEGPWLVTLDGPSYIAAMQHIKDRAIREQLYRVYLTRASDLEEIDQGGESRNNVPLIQETLTLRLEAAKILGYSNHAEKSLATKMASSVEAVRELANLVAAKALPMAYAELDAITTYAREHGAGEYSIESMPHGLMSWDVTFWSERYKEAKFDLKEEELLPYFSFEAVLDGLFSLVEKIFAIEVKPADGQAEVWHKDVRFFNVHDKQSGSSGEHIASFYLDPFSRPADKRGGAWMGDCIGKSEALGRNIPVAYLTCNGRPPVGNTPSLMSFREVETLFHEFGHGLQHMLTKATVGDVAGINGIEWDAVELPSQFMENWCYHKPTVDGFAKHYQTGEPLPEDMFNKLKLQKTFNAGMMTMRQVYFGQMDMELHSAYDPDAKEETIFDVQRRIASIYSPHLMPMEVDRFVCAFSHIFAGGYSAGYYSYLWAEVMSADAFGAFEDVGLDNEVEVEQVGRSFRNTVLSLGGGVNPSDVYRRFRGRDPTAEAMLRHRGLS